MGIGMGLGVQVPCETASTKSSAEGSVKYLSSRSWQRGVKAGSFAKADVRTKRTMAPSVAKASTTGCTKGQLCASDATGSTDVNMRSTAAVTELAIFRGGPPGFELGIGVTVRLPT